MLKKVFRTLYKERRVRLAILAISAGAMMTFTLQYFDMNFFEARAYDFRMRLRAKTPKSDRVVIVKIDDKTIEALNEFSPLSLKHHVDLLKEVGRASPKAIAYLVNFSEVMQLESSSQEKETQKNAEDFVSMADGLFASGVPMVIGTEIDVTGEVVPPFPLSKLPHRIAVIHKDGSTFSEDKVTRRAFFSIFDEPVMHVQLAGLFTNKNEVQDYKSIYQMPDVDAKFFMINFSQSTKEGLHQFEEISAIDIIDKKVSPELLKDKIVLIGTKTKETSDDYLYTPYSREIFTNSKLVIHANIIETLINNNALQIASKRFDLIFTLLLTSFTIWMVFQTTPATGVLFTMASAATTLVLATAAFRSFDVWIKLAHPLLGIFFAYYLFVPYRLILEYKKRWEFQQKNDVLMQVEELKSNFMSLITHDLKTPVARIQGMAEVLSRNNADPKVISEIFSSTDELNRFITSILELAKIESGRIPLDKQSKDINKIAEDCIRKFQFQAKARNISITADLEPLFPIKVDAPMIAKVISNLIDNAIKYSGDDAQITIESRESTEVPGFIEISVTDTGFGIAEKDIENLFSKFYRPKNDITLQTKGTGLGLYLSRYFVELHHGSLTVESVEGRGSIFTILLPIESVDNEGKSDAFIQNTPSQNPKGVTYV